MKMYTLDGALLTERPEIRIGDKVYPVDDRADNVTKIMELQQKQESGTDSIAAAQKIFEMAMGKSAAKEIAELKLSYVAYQKLIVLVMAALTGEDPEALEQRFQKAKDAAV